MKRRAGHSLRRRYGRAVRMTEADERAELRKMLDHRQRLNDYIAGVGPFCLPITSNESALFTKLGRKYKYDPEFVDALHVYAFKSASTRSRKR